MLERRSESGALHSVRTANIFTAIDRFHICKVLVCDGYVTVVLRRIVGFLLILPLLCAILCTAAASPETTHTIARIVEISLSMHCKELHQHSQIGALWAIECGDFDALFTGVSFAHSRVCYCSHSLCSLTLLADEASLFQLHSKVFFVHWNSW